MIIAYFPDGKRAFQSQNLRGIMAYGRKHTATVSLGDCVSGDGLYNVTYSNGATCKGSFADPRIMLSFFLGRGFVDQIICERTVFNKGAAMGRIALPFMCDIGRDGSMRFGPWMATAYRDEYGTALVKFARP